MKEEPALSRLEVLAGFQGVARWCSKTVPLSNRKKPKPKAKPWMNCLPSSKSLTRSNFDDRAPFHVMAGLDEVTFKI
jgi:hypothetical protein